MNKPAIYRKKSNRITVAVQFVPERKFATWNNLGYQNHQVGVGLHGVQYLITECGIITASGFVKLMRGDWICWQEINGKIDRWPVKPDIFAATYEPA